MCVCVAAINSIEGRRGRQKAVDVAEEFIFAEWPLPCPPPPEWPSDPHKKLPGSQARYRDPVMVASRLDRSQVWLATRVSDRLPVVLKQLTCETWVAEHELSMHLAANGVPGVVPLLDTFWDQPRGKPGRDCFRVLVFPLLHPLQSYHLPVASSSSSSANISSSIDNAGSNCSNVPPSGDADNCIKNNNNGNLESDGEVEATKRRRRKPTCQLEQIHEHLVQLLVCLKELHDQRRIVHLDIKPSNLVQSPDGHIFLIDFGLSRVSLSLFLYPSVLEQRSSTNIEKTNKTKGVWSVDFMFSGNEWLHCTRAL